MKPDGILPDDRRKRPPPTGRGSRWRPLQWIRGLLGFRRRPGVAPYPFTEDTIPDEDPDFWVRARPYVRVALLFGAAALVVFWVYGALADDPTAISNPDAGRLITQAVVAAREGDLAAAERLREQAAESMPDDPALYYLDGHLLAARGEDTQALTKRAWTRRAKARSLIALAGHCEASGDLAGAAEALLKARRLAPNATRIRLLRGVLLLALDRTAEAVAEADELEEITGPTSHTLKLRGDAYLNMDRPDLACPQYEAARMYAQSTPAIDLPLAEALLQSGRPDEAIDLVRDVIRHSPQNADARLLMGIIQANLGKVDDAEAAYRKAIEIDPNHVKSLNNLAYLLCADRGKPAAALEYAARAHKLASSSPMITDTLGWTYSLLGRHDEALPLLRRAADLAPDDPEISLHLAESLIATGGEAEGTRRLRDLAAGEQDTPVRKQARSKLRPPEPEPAPGPQ